MLPAWRIIIRQNGYMGATQCGGIGLAPLPSAHRVAGRHDPQGVQGLDILLPLNEAYESSRLYGLPDVRQPIEYQFSAIEVPSPAALAIRPPLSERFRHEPHRLKQHHALSIDIIVGLGNPVGRGGMIEQILHRDSGLLTHHLKHVLLITPDTAHQHNAFITIGNLKGGMVVIMGRTPHQVPTTNLAEVAQPRRKLSCLHT
jgi:hypothetical protein